MEKEEGNALSLVGESLRSLNPGYMKIGEIGKIGKIGDNYYVIVCDSGSGSAYLVVFDKYREILYKVIYSDGCRMNEHNFDLLITGDKGDKKKVIIKPKPFASPSPSPPSSDGTDPMNAHYTTLVRGFCEIPVLCTATTQSIFISVARKLPCVNHVLLSTLVLYAEKLVASIMLYSDDTSTGEHVLNYHYLLRSLLELLNCIYVIKTVVGIVPSCDISLDSIHQIESLSTKEFPGVEFPELLPILIDSCMNMVPATRQGCGAAAL